MADAHRGIDDASRLSFVSGSTLEGLADSRSDVDMSLVFQRMGDERALLADDDKRAVWVLVPARMARLPGDSATREPRG